MRRSLWSIIIGVLLVVAMPAAVRAVDVVFELQSEDFRIGQPMEVGVFVDTHDEPINAIEGRIVLPSGLSAALKRINTGNSIVSLWVEQPKSITDRAVTFSGVIPGGYSEARGLLFSLVFVPTVAGTGTLTAEDMRILGHDGRGTELSVRVFPSMLKVSDAQTPAVPRNVDEYNDHEPPESFSPLVVQDPAVADGKFVLIFLTQDKRSGVVGYEVREGDRAQVNAKSPYVLQNQRLDQDIAVIARDAAGNETVATVPAPRPRAWYRDRGWMLVATVSIFALCVYLLWSRTQKNG